MDYLWIRSSVECPGGTDEAFYSVERETWEAMTEDERSDFLVEVAVTHQNEVAACGARLVPDDELDEIPEGQRADPAAWSM